jgi:spore germination protein
MEIYIVQLGDNIHSIANKFGMSAERLISDNGLINPNNLVIGQTLIILYPTQTYTIQFGDTLNSITQTTGITMQQLIRNNPILYDSDKIYPGESLVIHYSQDTNIEVNGFTYTYTSSKIIERTLPYLTYLSIFNYQITENANVIHFGDDSEMIKTAKYFQTVPLLMISTYSPTGELNLDNVYELLINEEKQVKLVNELLKILKSNGFFGINALISHINESNENLYFNVLSQLSKALKKEGYFFHITINPKLIPSGNTYSFDKLNYANLSAIADKMIFLQNNWSKNIQPPAPVSNISLIRPFIRYVTSFIPPQKLSLGKPLIGYDWQLPFIPGTTANSLSLNSAITLAYDRKSTIYLDEKSQTPYYNYTSANADFIEKHIVWFLDARSINALDDVIVEYNLDGSGIWNLAVYNQQLWSIINARFSIIKLLHT